MADEMIDIEVPRDLTQGEIHDAQQLLVRAWKRVGIDLRVSHGWWDAVGLGLAMELRDRDAERAEDGSDE